jgi:hypothetical protein
MGTVVNEPEKTGVTIRSVDTNRLMAAGALYNEAFTPKVLIDLIERLEKHEFDKRDREDVSYETLERIRDGVVIPPHTRYMEDVILARLIDEEVIMINSRHYVEGSWEDIKSGKWDGRTGEVSKDATIVAFVKCSDIFAWGCADNECVSMKELPELWNLHKDPALKGWGSAIWCMKKRNEQPQPPVKKMMIEAGAWSDELEALAPNTMDAETQSAFAQVAQQLSHEKK